MIDLHAAEEDVNRLETALRVYPASSSLFSASADHSHLIGTRWRSVKRGSLYRITDMALGQGPACWLLGDGIPVVLYREIRDGRLLFSRPLWQFFMRFEPIR